MTHLLVKLKDGLQKSSLLWVSALLKFRWAEVLKLRKDPTYQSTLAFLKTKSQTMPRYFELKAKLDMVIQTHESIAAQDEEMKEAVPMNHQQEQSEQSDTDEELERVEMNETDSDEDMEDPLEKQAE